ncbi:MAG TPA: FixH family protein [Anaerolineae bacterium]|nr:FixH family protein [Anaerolineae bacterium]
MRLRILFLLLGFALLAGACAQGATEIKPPEIRYGEDVCVECIMIISDPRFAAAYTYEVSPGRYENALFDDIGDMLIYADKHPEHEVVAWWVHDYDTKEWVEGAKAIYMFSHSLQTPMAQGTAAFATLGPAQQLAEELNGEVFDWNGLVERHRAGKLMVDASLSTAVGASLADAAQPSAPEPVAQGEATVDGYQVQLLSAAPLHAGYNPVTVALTGPDGQPVADTQVTLTPFMDMVDGRHHGSGVEGPVQTAPGVYDGALIFSMPGGPDLGSWQVTAAFTDTVAGVSGSIPLPVEVTASKLYGSFVGPEEMKIFLSVVEPTTPVVGRQPFEVYVMQKRGMFDWPTLDELTLEITPEMPTMGHGSPGNENPVALGNGHYLGQINFSMSGPWTVTVVVKDGDIVLGEVVFEYDVR